MFFFFLTYSPYLPFLLSLCINEYLSHYFTNVKTIEIQKVISRDEKNYVEIRERQFICAARISDQERIMEIRYNVGSQKWKIFQFLA